MAKISLCIFIVATAALANSAVPSAAASLADDALSPREVLRLGVENAARGGETSMRGVVTFVEVIFVEVKKSGSTLDCLSKK